MKFKLKLIIAIQMQINACTLIIAWIHKKIHINDFCRLPRAVVKIKIKSQFKNVDCRPEKWTSNKIL